MGPLDSSHGRLLGLDPSGFDDLCRTFTLAQHEARKLCPASTRPMSFTSLSITPAGVPAGAHSPYQMGKSKPATPASAIVGTSGNRAERRAVLTPSATSVPSRMWGKAREMGTK